MPVTLDTTPHSVSSSAACFSTLYCMARLHATSAQPTTRGSGIASFASMWDMGVLQGVQCPTSPSGQALIFPSACCFLCSLTAGDAGHFFRHPSTPFGGMDVDTSLVPCTRRMASEYGQAQCVLSNGPEQGDIGQYKLEGRHKGPPGAQGADIA